MRAVEVQRPDGRGVSQLTLGRPDRANAMNSGLVEELLEALEKASRDGIRLLVVRGQGRNFCGGFDLSGIEAASDGDLAMRFVRIEQMLQTLSSAPFFSVACIQGAAFGAGADLVVACDYRLGAPSSRFRFPGYRFGVALGTRRLAATVGTAIAQDILTSGRIVNGDEAQRCGLLTTLLDEAQMSAAIDDIANQLSKLAPEAIKALTANSRHGHDAADEDLAALVKSVATPGLQGRLRQYLANAKKPGQN